MGERESVEFCCELLKTLKEQSELVKCPICLEIFTEPIQLKCKHSFCAACLETNIKLNVVCPICRRLINRREKHFNDKINGLAIYVKAMLGKLENVIDISKYKFRSALPNKDNQKAILTKIKTSHQHLMPNTFISPMPETIKLKQTAKNVKEVNLKVKSVLKNKENHKPILNRTKWESTDIIPTSIIEKKAPSTRKSRKDAFDVLLESSRNNNFARPLKTYGNKNKIFKNQICDNIIEFEDETNKSNVLKWLADNRNKFDNIALTQQENDEDAASVMSFDFDSISQAGKNKGSKEYQRQLKDIRKSRAELSEKSRYERRCRSLDIHLSRYFYQKPLKRRSLACESQDFEHIEIEEIDSEKLIVTKEQKKMYNLLEDACLNKLNAMFAEPVQKDNSKKSDKIKVKTGIEKATTSGNSSGWKRMKDMKKIIKKQERNPRKLKVSQQSKINSSIDVRKTKKPSDDNSTLSYSSPEKDVNILDNSPTKPINRFLNINKEKVLPFVELNLMEDFYKDHITGMQIPFNPDSDVSSPNHMAKYALSSPVPIPKKGLYEPSLQISSSEEEFLLDKVGKGTLSSTLREMLLNKAKKASLSNEEKELLRVTLNAGPSTGRLSDRQKEMLLNKVAKGRLSSEEKDSILNKMSSKTPKKNLGNEIKGKSLKSRTTDEKLGASTSKRHSHAKVKPKVVTGRGDTKNLPFTQKLIKKKNTIDSEENKPLAVLSNKEVGPIKVPSKAKVLALISNDEELPSQYKSSKALMGNNDEVTLKTSKEIAKDNSLSSNKHLALNNDADEELPLQNTICKASLSKVEDKLLDTVLQKKSQETKKKITNDSSLSNNKELTLSKVASKDNMLEGVFSSDEDLPLADIISKAILRIDEDQLVDKVLDTNSEDTKKKFTNNQKVASKEMLSDKEQLLSEVLQEKPKDCSFTNSKELVFDNVASKANTLEVALSSEDEELSLQNKISKALLSGDEDKLLSKISPRNSKKTQKKITNNSSFSNKKELTFNEVAAKSALSNNEDQLVSKVSQKKSMETKKIMTNDSSFSKKKESAINKVASKSILEVILSSDDEELPLKNIISKAALSSDEEEQLLKKVSQKSSIKRLSGSEIDMLHSNNTEIKIVSSRENRFEIDKEVWQNNLESTKVGVVNIPLKENSIKPLQIGNDENKETNELLPHNDNLQDVDEVPQNVAKKRLLGKGIDTKIKLNTNDRNILREYVEASNRKTTCEVINIEEIVDRKRMSLTNSGESGKTIKSAFPIPKDESTPVVVSTNPKKLIGNETKALATTSLMKSQETGYKSSFEAESPKFRMEYTRQKLKEKISPDEKALLARSCHKKRRLNTQEVNVLLHEGELITRKYTTRFGDTQNEVNENDVGKRNIQQNSSGKDILSGTNKIVHREDVIANPEVIIEVEHSDPQEPINVENPKNKSIDTDEETIFDIATQLSSDVEVAESEIKKMTHLLQETIKQFKKIKSTTDPQLLRFLSGKFDRSNNFDSAITYDLLKKFDTILNFSCQEHKFNLDDSLKDSAHKSVQTIEDLNPILANVGTQTVEQNKFDKSLQTEFHESGFLISATEEFKTQTNGVVSIQTDPIICGNCNYSLKPKKPSNSLSVQELSASFDGLDFDTQALKDNNKLNRRASNFESQFVKSGSFDGLVFETQAAIEENAKNVSKSGQQFMKSGNSKLNQKITSECLLNKPGTSTANPITCPKNMLTNKVQLLNSGFTKTVNTSNISQLRSDVDNFIFETPTASMESIRKHAKTDTQLLQSGSFDGLVFETQDAINESENIKKQLSNDSRFLQSGSFDGLVFETQAAIVDNARNKATLPKRTELQTIDDKTVTQILNDLNNANSELVMSSTLIGTNAKHLGRKPDLETKQSIVQTVAGTSKYEKVAQRKGYLEKDCDYLQISQVIKSSTANKKKRSQKFNKTKNSMKSTENSYASAFYCDKYLNDSPLSPDLVAPSSYRKQARLRQKELSNCTKSEETIINTSKKRSMDDEDDLVNSKIVKFSTDNKRHELDNYVGNMKKLLLNPKMDENDLKQIETNKVAPESYLLDLERDAPSDNSDLVFSVSDGVGKHLKPNVKKFKRIASNSDSDDGNPKKNKYLREDISVCFDTETQGANNTRKDNSVSDVINMDILNNMYDDAIGTSKIQVNETINNPILPLKKTKSQELLEKCGRLIENISNKCNTSFKSSKIPVQTRLSESLFNTEPLTVPRKNFADKEKTKVDYCEPKNIAVNTDGFFNSDNVIQGTLSERTNHDTLTEFHNENELDEQMAMIKSKDLKTRTSINALIEEHDGIEFLGGGSSMLNEGVENKDNVAKLDAQKNDSMLNDDLDIEGWKSDDFKEKGIRILQNVVVPTVDDAEDDIINASGSDFDVDVIETTPQKPTHFRSRKSQVELSVIEEIDVPDQDENIISPDVFNEADITEIEMINFEKTYVPKQQPKILPAETCENMDILPLSGKMGNQNKQTLLTLRRPGNIVTSTEKYIKSPTEQSEKFVDSIPKSSIENSLWGSESGKISPIKKLMEEKVISQNTLTFLKKTSTPVQTSIKKFMTKTKKTSGGLKKGVELFKFSTADPKIGTAEYVPKKMAEVTGKIEHPTVGRSNAEMSKNVPKLPEMPNKILHSDKISQDLTELTHVKKSAVKPQSKKICLTISRLPKEKSNRIIQFVNKHQTVMDLSHDFNSHVTHLIVDVRDDNCLHAYTAKFVQAVANRLWVVRYDWITECIKADNLVSEEPFEVLDGRSEPGPRISRLFGHEKPLLKGFRIYICPPISTLSVTELHVIIVKLGGQIVLDPNDFLHKRKSDICVIIAENEKTQDINKYEMWLQDLKVITVELEWLTFSVGQYRWKTLRRYALCSEDFDDLDYPQELLECVPLTPPSSCDDSDDNIVENEDIK